jgi:muramoyltetrapeptide carboxypeptidase
MAIRYPAPLQPGDRIGVTSPSSGVDVALRPRLDVCLKVLRDRGFEPVVGQCMDGSTVVSAPAAERAHELMQMLTDPAVRAVVPPWGGELAIDLLPLLDWDAIASAEPTWFVGYSDISTLLTPITLRTGVATLHGNNLMDTPYVVPAPLRSWLDIAVLGPGDSVTQGPAARYRSGPHADWVADPACDTYALDMPGTWTRLDADEPVTVSGRLIGGCIETLSNLGGSAYADVAGFVRDHAPEGLLVYVEACDADAYDIARRLHGMRLAGWFAAANAVLVGRTAAPGHEDLSQHGAVLHALGGLGVPLVADVECGHVAPHLPLVNGALAELVWSPATMSLTQTLT